MAVNHATLSSRHPKVLLIHDSDEDILGAASIIAEQVDDFRAIHFDDKTSRQLKKYKPVVILFAMQTVNESIELYAELVANQTLVHIHQSILLCKNKESGIAFRTCIKNLFDNYFVYQPLYEKFRLKMIVHAALVFSANTSKYKGFEEEQLEQVDEDLAQLIEQGGECRKVLLDSIQECKDTIKEATLKADATPSTPEVSQQEMLEQITKSHVEPLLESLEENILSSLDGLVSSMVDQRRENHERSQQTLDKIETAAKQEGLATHKASVTKHNGKAESDINEEEVNGAAAILVVEDNEMYRDMLVRVLSKEKWRVDVAIDGIDGLKKIRDNRYDCILMDLFMPKMDGLNATKQIKKVSGGRDIPVIALTGNKKKELIKKWASCGIKSYIVKPSSKNEILTAVNKVLAS